VHFQVKVNRDQNFCQCHPAMNPSLWFLLHKEFGALQTSLLKYNRRLNAAGGSEVPRCDQGQSSGRGSGARSPQKLKLSAHLHIFCIFCPTQDFFARQRGNGPSGPMVNTLVPPPPIYLVLSPSPPSFPPPRKAEGPWILPGKKLKF